jgi:coenzyme F420-0:L-glutamate ligase/coenzyme F420-1:gamma-L-glutamate ligase
MAPLFEDPFPELRDAKAAVHTEKDAPRRIEIFPVTGIGEVAPGQEVAEIILAAAGPVSTGEPKLRDGDVVVVTQKIVSKAEGRLVEIDPDDSGSFSRLVESESVRVLRRRGDLLISETRHGFICANAGVDRSNVADGTAALLPVDPDRSAHRIRIGLLRGGVDAAVIVSDTFGRPWRRGLTDVAIGCSGIGAILDLRGTPDARGRSLQATEVCIADEIAGAAELVMGKSSGIPVAIVRGVDPTWLRESSVKAEIVRPASEDLFR